MTTARELVVELTELALLVAHPLFGFVSDVEERRTLGWASAEEAL